MKKLIIEVRVNERAMRDRNPHVPWTPGELAEDAAACREAGAASIHYHPRDAAGAADLTFESFRDAARLIRASSDLLLHPTLGSNVQAADPATRAGNVARLAAEGLAPEFAPLDMGSTNADILDESCEAFRTEDQVYVNATGTLRYLAETFRRSSVKPYLHIWNIPNLRLAEAFHRMGVLDGPLWIGFAHSGPAAPIHHPATPAGLQAYLGVLPPDLPAEWLATALGANLLLMAPQVIAAGGHISIGLGDYPYPELGCPTNAGLVAHVAALARSMGREVAGPAEAREMLAIA